MQQQSECLPVQIFLHSDITGAFSPQILTVHYGDLFCLATDGG